MLTVHKLISIGAVVFAVLFIISMLRRVSPSAWAVGMIVVAAVSAICLIATGGIMSAGNSHTVLKTLHIAATAMFMLSGAGMAVLLISRL